LNHISVISLFDAYIEIDVYIEGGRHETIAQKLPPEKPPHATKGKDNGQGFITVGQMFAIKILQFQRTNSTFNMIA
jgi:hypothetical protein